MRVLPCIYCGNKESIDVCGLRKQDTDEMWQILTAEGPICIKTQGEFSISCSKKQRLSWLGKSRSSKPTSSAPGTTEAISLVSHNLHNVLKGTKDGKIFKRKKKVKQKRTILQSPGLSSVCNLHKRQWWTEKKGRKGTPKTSVPRGCYYKQIYKTWWCTNKWYPLTFDLRVSYRCLLLMLFFFSLKQFFLREGERTRGRKSHRICLLWLVTVTKVSVMECVCSMTIH